MIWRKEEKFWYWGILLVRSLYLLILLFFFFLIKYWNLFYLIKILEGNFLVIFDLFEIYVFENWYIVRYIIVNDFSIVVLILFILILDVCKVIIFS